MRLTRRTALVVVAIGAMGTAGFVPTRSGRAQESGATTTATAPAASGPVVDAALPSMLGEHRLSEERGRRALILFYEDRAHIYDNDDFKGELRRYVTDNHLEERMVLYGVANLADVGMVPEALVRSMIQPAIERWGSDIMLDWDGVMRRPPFSFATDSANVALIDRSGRLVYHHAGRMDETRRREFYRALRAALR